MASTKDFSKCWSEAKHRCVCPTSRDYKNYGGRGITMFKPWQDDYKAFEKYILETIGPRPLNMSLDRIDNNKGYVPGNLRWATQSQQNYNKRIPKINNSTGERGISCRKSRGDYMVNISVKGCVITKACKTLQEAIKVRDSLMEQNNAT